MLVIPSLSMGVLGPGEMVSFPWMYESADIPESMRPKPSLTELSWSDSYLPPHVLSLFLVLLSTQFPWPRSASHL